ncbi:MAG: peptidylprolyl isomerase [Spirochaetales bacterium]|nr:peptidylprolyl isomerase [Leptospiraceae bacterium]MCP5481646.1 peptidylprolyl isomerase [Spirochaetales bacterium]MCP5484474.1 peptidylprolyl isomerase [Spirochaetales bacterium]
MQIDKHSVVTINYTLKDNEGNVIDTSEGNEPLTYLHGVGQLVSGLENALQGKQENDQVSVKIPPDEGYGQRNEELVQSLPRDAFRGIDQIEVGMQFQSGHSVVTVTNVGIQEITVDGNHPLAGYDLNFDVEVVGLRAATKEEIDHGHVHGAGGHHH